MVENGKILNLKSSEVFSFSLLFVYFVIIYLVDIKFIKNFNIEGEKYEKFITTSNRKI